MGLLTILFFAPAFAVEPMTSKPLSQLALLEQKLMLERLLDQEQLFQMKICKRQLILIFIKFYQLYRVYFLEQKMVMG
jgi:hypothetical protein